MIYNESVKKKKPASPAIGGTDPKALLNVADFESIQIEFDVTNTTTGTLFRKNVSIRVAQIGERGMHLEVPRRSCAMGHSLAIKLHIRNIPRADDLEFEATAKVETLETFEQGGDSIGLQILQCDERQWQRFLEIFSSRQKEIEEFFAAARGY